MVWAILLLLGVPLWLCVARLSVLVFHNRALRHRFGNVKVRRRQAGKSRWTCGHGIWVNDVFGSWEPGGVGGVAYPCTRCRDAASHRGEL